MTRTNNMSSFCLKIFDHYNYNLESSRLRNILFNHWFYDNNNYSDIGYK